MPIKTFSDRYIPSRSATNFELSHYKILQQWKNPTRDPTKQKIQNLMGEALHGGNINNIRVLSYQSKTAEGYQNPLKVLYTHKGKYVSWKHQADTAGASTRHISLSPNRVLDAPDLINDYHLINLVDWSTSNILAVGLNDDLYLWNAKTETIEHLFKLDTINYVTSVAWMQKGPHLAVGTSKGSIELWDCHQMRRMHVINGHTSRVSSLAWNSHILTSGCRSGTILHHDVRQQNHIISSINTHTENIYNLKWSHNGQYLASGSDWTLQIWSIAGRSPIYSFKYHFAIKALAWCPWQNNILASSGGYQTIKFWNINTGACLNKIDTKAELCALLWSENYKEIVSGHGYARNKITIWKYPSMTKVTDLKGHKRRVFHLSMSPNKTTMISASGDETLRLWKCFQMKKQYSDVKHVQSDMFGLKQSIR